MKKLILGFTIMAFVITGSVYVFAQKTDQVEQQKVVKKTKKDDKCCSVETKGECDTNATSCCADDKAHKKAKKKKK